MYSPTVAQLEEPPKTNVEEDYDQLVLPTTDDQGEQPLIYRNIIIIAVLHIIALYAFFTKCHEAKLYTWILNIAWGLAAGLGITAGAHRLWAHRTYSAKLPLRIFLAIMYSMSGLTPFYIWIKDHRIHHKFTDTQADPHDASRGFFFSHLGWLMVKRHPAIKKYGGKMDMSDITADPVTWFFNKYYLVVTPLLTLVIPSLIPVYGWNESWYIAINAALFRWLWLMHAIFAVNSFAHIVGNRPYNKNLKPTENAVVAFFTLGEGWHNYHHAFPSDYKAAELGSYGLNPSTAFIEAMAWLGLAYDLKTPNKELIEKVSLNKGDGTTSLWGNDYHHKDQQQQKCS